MFRQLLSGLKRAHLPAIPELQGSEENPVFRIVETYLFDTCTHRCGYCWLAESGQVLDFQQLERFRSAPWIDSVTRFFNSRTTDNAKWLLQLSGGEPLIAPNLARLCKSLFEHGNRAAFYTALLVGRNHPGFRFLESAPAPAVDYVMASFHPEAELDEGRYFEKLIALRDAGHRVFLRFVGHPARLSRLAELAEKCARLNICFYPTTLLSSTYPGAYNEDQRNALRTQFTSLSQFIMLEGGIDTRKSQCFAGSKIIAANLQTGDITPCISVHHPVIGNVFRNELKLYSDSISCPEAGINCSCDVHFQQNIVKGCYDNADFQVQKSGFATPALGLQEKIEALRETAGFYVNPSQGIGRVQDESRLFYSIEEVRRNYRVNHGLPE
jgi:organic radical activating enzyme